MHTQKRFFHSRKTNKAASFSELNIAESNDGSVLLDELATMGGFEYLSEEQISLYKDAFGIYGDSDGTVSTRELGPMLQYLGQNPTTSEIQEMANECDADGSGSVDFPEFLQMMAKKLAEIDSEVTRLRLGLIIPVASESDVFLFLNLSQNLFYPWLVYFSEKSCKEKNRSDPV